MSSKEGYSTLKFCMLKFQPSSTTEMFLTFVFHTSLNLYFFFFETFFWIKDESNFGWITFRYKDVAHSNITQAQSIPALSNMVATNHMRLFKVI